MWQPLAQFAALLALVTAAGLRLDTSDNQVKVAGATAKLPEAQRATVRLDGRSNERSFKHSFSDSDYYDYDEEEEDTSWRPPYLPYRPSRCCRKPQWKPSCQRRPCYRRPVCRSPLITLEDDSCHKTGSFEKVPGTGRLTSTKKLGSPIPAQTAAVCKTFCGKLLPCMAFDFSDTDKTCTFYEEGVIAETGSGSAAESYVWRFAKADGEPFPHYKEVDGKYLAVRWPRTPGEAPYVCYVENAILYPAVTEEAAEAVSALHNGEKLIVGIDDMVVEGEYVSSEGEDLVSGDLPWKAGEPGGASEDCVVLETTSELSTTACTGNDWNVRALCQFVGDNLALNKRVWMNAFKPDDDGKPSHAVDGNVYNNIAGANAGGQAIADPTTWMVDLGTTCQVTSVVYVSRQCCANRNKNTEIRVGSDPHNFDDTNSVVCVALPDQFIDEGYARQYHCAVPITGRYVQVKRDQKTIMDFADFAVQGNCLDNLKLPCDHEDYCREE